MRRVLLLAALAGSGCLDVGTLADPSGPYNVSVHERDSELPSFDGPPGDVYPVVLVHAHYQYGEGRALVVCLETGPLVPAGGSREAASASMSVAEAPCANRVDESRGAAQVERPAFDEAQSVLFAGSAYCYERVHYLGSQEQIRFDLGGRSFIFQSQPSGVYLVDGEHELRAGRALRFEYFIPDGDPGRKDDTRVTVLFDHPGTWLRARAGPNPPFLENERLPPPPPQAPRSVVALPRQADTLGEVLDPLLSRHGWSDAAFLNLTTTWMEGELFEISVRAEGYYADTVQTTEQELLVEVVEMGWTGPEADVTLGDTVHAFDDLPLDGILDRARIDGDFVTGHIATGRGYKYEWLDQVVPRQLNGGSCVDGSCLWVYANEPLEGQGWHLVHIAGAVQDSDAATWILEAYEGTNRRAEFYPGTQRG